ncbi:MAG TPA: AsnC family transcriptional regulator, partial [Tepidisphaeraceae bacterium]|nr:AsnC family transcriptional regulator [Tepidisphaeraceae bacterium]
GQQICWPARRGAEGMMSTPAAQLDELDLKLLDLLQQELPLVERPFAALAQRLGIDEEQVLRRVRQLRAGPRGVIRQISAIFDSRSLGYVSSLVAAKVDEARIDAAAEQINLHPGVSHNYRRNHAYNLWYTIAVPPHSRLGLERTVQELHRRSGAIVTRLMPALKLYKIGVRFNLSGEPDAATRSDEEAGFASGTEQQATEQSVISDADKRMIRLLQQDLPLEPRPFEIWAQQAKVPPQQVLESAQRYLRLGWMRRFSAVLRHREAGFVANAMGAWIVPPQQRDAFGALAASFPAVSHCYQRPTYEDWPYSMFTMVHGQTPADCERVLSAISHATGTTQYTALYSSREYKKVRVRYFMGDIEAWEAQVLADSQR